MRKLDISKATNCEDFPAWVSKEACEDLCLPLTDIINCILQTNSYPKLWKKAEIRPLKKVKNPSNPSDYRPKSLLHRTGKIAEQIILSKLKTGLGEKLKQNQYAYQQRRSTTDALLNVIHDWCKELDDLRTSHLTATLIDMSIAFDKMDPNILIKKLQILHIHTKIIGR